MLGKYGRSEQWMWILQNVQDGGNVGFLFELQLNVHRDILPGNSKSLWHAVKIAKNIGESEIPDNMTLNNEPVNCDDISESFAEFFEKKLFSIIP